MTFTSFRRFLGLLVLAAAGGCTAVPTGQVIEEAGPMPTLQQGEAVILGHLARALRDPRSMVDFKVTRGPELLTATNAGKNLERAWLFCAEYNAKNAYGGYVGIKTESFAIRNAGGSLFIVSPINWVATDLRC